MEQSEVYKSVETKIKSLAACDDTIKQCEQSGTPHKHRGRVEDKVYLFTHIHSGREAEKDIEEHFARCINALAERKAVLLKEVTQKATALSNIHTTSFNLPPL